MGVKQEFDEKIGKVQCPSCHALYMPAVGCSHSSLRDVRGLQVKAGFAERTKSMRARLGALIEAKVLCRRSTAVGDTQLTCERFTCPGSTSGAGSGSCPTPKGGCCAASFCEFGHSSTSEHATLSRYSAPGPKQRPIYGAIVSTCASRGWRTVAHSCYRSEELLCVRVSSLCV